MKRDIDLHELRELIEPIIENHSAELVDIELKGRIGNQILRIFVDTENGITLRLCERISRDISDILDQKDFFPGKYRLEVSSPGLDRPLKTWKDFRRNISRKVRIDFLDSNGDERRLEGIIEEVEEEMVFVSVKDDKVAIPLEQIKLAKILPIW